MRAILSLLVLSMPLAGEGVRARACQGVECGEPQSHEIRSLLVVPSLKFMFCFIPKNACTQFNMLMNALNGIVADGPGCSPNNPVTKSSMKHFDFNETQIMKALGDPTWTKAVFLRDPLERLVSAYRSKCENDECDHSCLSMNFSKTVEKLPRTHNWHWLPQSGICGGLADMIGTYDFVGNLTHDYKANNRQVREMLHMALDRSPAARIPGLLRGAAATESVSAWVNRYFTPSSASDWSEPFFHGYRAPTARAEGGGPTKEQLDGAAQDYFPPGSNGAGPEHQTGTFGGQDYYSPATVTRALQYYRTDYERLPGLAVPAWASQMAALGGGEDPED